MRQSAFRLPEARAEGHLIDQYRRFLRTSYRFLDEHLRRQLEAHLAGIDGVVRGLYVTLAREFPAGTPSGR